MRTGCRLSRATLNPQFTYSKVTATAVYATDEARLNIGVLIRVESQMLTAVVIKDASGVEIYRSPVRRLKHYVLDRIPCSAGVTITVRYLASVGTLKLDYTPQEMAESCEADSLTEWPWRYFWGARCPTSVAGRTSWERIRRMGGAFIELPDCLPVLSWRNPLNVVVALAVYPAEAPADEWKPEKSSARKVYYTPPLLPEEVDHLRSLMTAATGISVSDGDAPARLEDMTVAANYSDGQQLIKLTFSYELR